MSDAFAISEEDIKFFIDQFHSQTGKFPKFDELIEMIQYTTSESIYELKHQISELIDHMVDRGILSWEKKRIRLHSPL
ncbi:MAG: hypothetical protein ACFFCD_13230 [Promethearchaeota archaeon]